MSQRSKKRRTPKKQLPAKRSLFRVNKYFFIIPLSLIILSFASLVFLHSPEKPKAQQPEPPKNETIASVPTGDDAEKLKKIIEANKQYENKTSVLDQPKTEEPNQTAVVEHEYKLSEIEDYHKSKTLKEPEIKPTKPVVKKVKKEGLPKLAIIIDDVAFWHQAKGIKNTGLKITPSVMPKSTRHPDTPKIAESFSFYMLHMPMEALNFGREEKMTLKTDDDKAAIETKVNKMVKDFPIVKYINNHTGSKFTADADSMDTLFAVLTKKGYIFVDSRTTAKTKAGNVAQKYHANLLSRDIFLDNEQDRNYIRGQLKKAVKKAKKNGYAVAIGHPGKVTLQTLKHSSDILSGVEVIYLDKLYDFVYN